MDFKQYKKLYHLETAIRNFLETRELIEARVPVLHTAAIPEAHIALFESRFRPPAWSGLDSLPLLLLPSPELVLKKLLALGWPSLYALAPSFRNEESISPRHSPEFTMLEIYLRGADYLDSLELLFDMFKYLSGPAKLPAKDFPNLAVLEAPATTLSLAQAFEKFAGIDLAHAAEPEDSPTGNAEALRRLAAATVSSGLAVAAHETWEDLFHRVLLTHVEPMLPENSLTVLIDYPARLPSTARRKKDSPWCERWELYLGTLELANVYTEETDPLRLRSFFENQESALRQAGWKGTVDSEFIEASTQLALLSGSALGLERLAMAVCAENNIENFRIFPWQKLAQGRNGDR